MNDSMNNCMNAMMTDFTTDFIEFNETDLYSFLNSETFDSYVTNYNNYFNNNTIFDSLLQNSVESIDSIDNSSLFNNNNNNNNSNNNNEYHDYDNYSNEWPNISENQVFDQNNNNNNFINNYVNYEQNYNAMFANNDNNCVNYLPNYEINNQNGSQPLITALTDVVIGVKAKTIEGQLMSSQEFIEQNSNHLELKGSDERDERMATSFTQTRIQSSDAINGKTSNHLRNSCEEHKTHKMANKMAEKIAAKGLLSLSSGLTSAERTRLQRQRNRIAAKKCRQRKLDQINTFQIRKNALIQNNQRLDDYLSQTRTRIFQIKTILLNHRFNDCKLNK